MGRQLNAAQPLAHISPTLKGIVKDEGKVKASEKWQQPVRQGKNCLISEGEVEQRKKTHNAKSITYHLTQVDRCLASSWAKKGQLPSLFSSLFYCWACCHVAWNIFLFVSSAWFCPLPTFCAPSIYPVVVGWGEGRVTKNRRPWYCANAGQ